MRYLLVALLLFASPAFAVNLSWDPSPSAGVLGYMLYYGEDPADLQYQQDVGDVLQFSVDDMRLAPGTWYFAVTAYNEAMESDQSNMVDYEQAGFVPVNILHTPVEKPSTITITIDIQ